MNSSMPMSNVDQVSCRSACLNITFLLGLVVAGGCESSRNESDYVPEASQARQALEKMLDSWQRGETSKPEFQLGTTGPRVQIIDKQFNSGKKLIKSEIVREMPTEPNGPRQIAVKLTFDGDETTVETTYFVVGINPLVIFRDSEYQQASGMG